MMNMKNGKCLNCGKQSESMFCDSCNPDTQKAGMIDEWFDGSTLPVEMEEDTIAGMIDGEIRYATPWAMFAAPNRKLYLNGKYTAHREIDGTVQMRIKKVAGEYIVDLSTIRDKKYSPSEPYYAGCTWDDFIPVRVVKHL